MSAGVVDRNTREYWESYFCKGWEDNRGRRQTRLFAKYFLETVPLPSDAKTLLDVGCAMGDAAPEFHRHRPDLMLTGCDASANAIARANESYGEIADFHVWTFDEIQGEYDVIYISNTLEHFTNYLEIAERLLERCDYLYIVVPYRELRRGKPLTYEPGAWHVATFDERTFDDLVVRGAGSGVRTWVRKTPGAWGVQPYDLVTKAKALLRGRLILTMAKQIFYEVRANRGGSPRPDGSREFAAAALGS